MSDIASYQKRQDGDSTVFETNPAPCPKYWFMLILGLLMGYLILQTGLHGLLGLIFFILPILAVWAFFRDPRPKGLRAPAKLRVAAGQLVTTTGLTLRNEEIKDISLDNVYDTEGSGTSVGVVDLGRKRKQKLRAVSWLLRLDRTNGEPSINIACGLDQDTAAKLLREVGEVLGRKATPS